MNTPQAPHTTEAHTPTPWRVYPSGTRVPGYQVCDRIVADKHHGRSNDDDMTDADAAFIVLACNSFDALTEANKKLREVLEHFTVRPSFHHECDDYSRGYGDALAVVATQAAAALKVTP